MKKLLTFAMLFALLGLFCIPQASAHRGGPHHYKTYKKAYKKGYKQGYRQARRDARHFRAYKRYKQHRYHPRYQERPVIYRPAYQPPSVSIHIPLPPAPPLPPLPPLPYR